VNGSISNGLIGKATWIPKLPRASYRQQLTHYVHALRADRGAVVYMTSGHIDWVDAAAGAPTALFGPEFDLQSDT
jgi:hypothetical protein